MTRLARLALVPLTLTAAAVPLTAQADAGVLGGLGGIRLYPLAGSRLDPLSNVVGTSLGGIPLTTRPVADAVSDGVPVRDLPLLDALR